MNSRRDRLLMVLVLSITIAAPLFPADAPSLSRRRLVARSPGSVELTFDFSRGLNGWFGGFSDYMPEANYGDLELRWEPAPLPPSLGAALALRLSSLNRADDIFMYLARRLGPEDGIRPLGSYVVDYDITFASEAPSGCDGIGGSPGEGVWLKAGAAGVFPEPVLAADRSLRMNVDKGEQAGGGVNASIVDTIGNGRRDCAQLEFVSLVRSHRHTHAVRANAAGELWLLVGTDSGYEGKTTLYYERIGVRLWQVPDRAPKAWR